MAGFSNAQEQAVLEYYFAGGSQVAQGTLYLALSQTAVLDDGTGLLEPTYGDYARIAVATTDWTYVAASVDPTALSNNKIIQFPECTEASSEYVVAWALMTAISAGTMLFSGTIVVPTVPPGLALGNGIQPQFDVGALQVRLGG